MPQVFMLRQKLAGRSRVKDALELGQVIIGWSRAKDLLNAAPSAYQDVIRKAYPEYSDEKLSRGAGEMRRFIHEMQIGDIVVIPAISDVYFAKITSDAIYKDHPLSEADDDAFRRNAEWLFAGKPTPKSFFPTELEKTLNSQHSILNLGSDSTRAQHLLLFIDEIRESMEGNLELPWTEDVLRSVKTRVDQRQFRLMQFKTHAGRCCVSGNSVAQALEAAHIVPHAQGDFDRSHSGNGLLLRADIHKLFDSHLMSINPIDLTVCVSKQLINTEYAIYDGKKIETSASTEKLQIRYASFLEEENKKPQPMAGA